MLQTISGIFKWLIIYTHFHLLFQCSGSIEKHTGMEFEDINIALPDSHRDEGDKEGLHYTTVQSDSGDMTFCISNYVKEAIKVWHVSLVVVILLLCFRF